MINFQTAKKHPEVFGLTLLRWTLRRLSETLSKLGVYVFHQQDITPLFYKLIEKFRQRTGISLLLNTSFNENEPIVNTPLEALDCYFRTDMDALIMGKILVIR
jgi:hypothetical protein